jgi:V/A-type H+-transporting ATPase subunit D
MELLKQKRRLETAKRAHDLLEDKRDKLIQLFFPLVRETRELRRQVGNRLSLAYGDFQTAMMISSGKDIEQSILWTDISSELAVTGQSSLGTPRFTAQITGDALCYGFHASNWKLDVGIRRFRQLLPELLELAHREEEVKRLAHEIERTRRRVNALEHILIPQISEAVKYITMKLEERERAHIINIMKVKDLIEKHSAAR